MKNRSKNQLTRTQRANRVKDRERARERDERNYHTTSTNKKSRGRKKDDDNDAQQPLKRFIDIVGLFCLPLNAE